MTMAFIVTSNAITIEMSGIGGLQFTTAAGVLILNPDVSGYSFTVGLYLLGSESDLSDIAYIKSVAPTFSTKSPVGNLQTQSYQNIEGYKTTDLFFMRAFATFNGVEYYMDIFKDGIYGSGYSYSGDWGDPSQVTVFNIGSGSFGGIGTAGDVGKWIAVPEPATAGLAFAGLALLFRRRRK